MSNQQHGLQIGGFAFWDGLVSRKDAKVCGDAKAFCKFVTPLRPCSKSLRLCVKPFPRPKNKKPRQTQCWQGFYIF